MRTPLPVRSARYIADPTYNLVKAPPRICGPVGTIRPPVPASQRRPKTCLGPLFVELHGRVNRSAATEARRQHFERRARKARRSWRAKSVRRVGLLCRPLSAAGSGRARATKATKGNQPDLLRVFGSSCFSRLVLNPLSAKNATKSVKRNEPPQRA